MPDEVVAPVHEGARRRPVSLQGERAREDGGGDVVLVEEANNPPDPDPAPELIHRLLRKLALSRASGIGCFAENLQLLVSVRPVQLGAFLVVDDDIEGQAGLVWPLERRRVLTVSNEVP